MKLIASGVTFSAAMQRSPSFSRSLSSMRMTIPPRRISSTASSMLASGTGNQCTILVRAVNRTFAALDYGKPVKIWIIVVIRCVDFAHIGVSVFAGYEQTSTEDTYGCWLTLRSHAQRRCAQSCPRYPCPAKRYLSWRSEFFAGAGTPKRWHSAGRFGLRNLRCTGAGPRRGPNPQATESASQHPRG